MSLCQSGRRSARRAASFAAAAVGGIVVGGLPLAADAEVLGVGRIRIDQIDGGTAPPREFTQLDLQFVVPFTSLQALTSPGVFANRPLTTDLSGGQRLVATAANDPAFAGAVAALTNGISDRAAAVTQWGPNPTSVNASLPFEAAFFGLPAGQVDFQGADIRSLTLQVNLLDIVASTNGTSFSRAYRFDALVIASDSEGVAAPVLPVAISGRAGGWRVNPGENLLLDASRSLGDIAEYKWDLNGDQAYDITTASPQLELTPAQYAPYMVADGKLQTVWLGVTDTAGNSSTDSRILRVVPEPSGVALVGLAAAGMLCRRRKALRA